MKEVHIFENIEFGSVRTIEEIGKVLFCGKDVAVALGYVNANDAIARHCKGKVKRDILTSGGVQDLVFITESDIYRLIIRSQLPSAEKFEHWVFDEVLPTIRQQGLYAVDDLLDNPDLAIKAFMVLKVEREKRKRAELDAAQKQQLIYELQPKATYYDLILQNKSLMPISKIAKDYGMSGRAFNKILHELGIQFYMGKTWLLYAEYADKGYTQSRTYAIGIEQSVMHTYWTQKGRLFLYSLLRNKLNLLPIIERGNAA